MEWQCITTAPRDGTEILVYVNTAATEIVRLAWWRSFDPFDEYADPTNEGWWTYNNSVTQEQLWWKPTHWLPFTPPLDAEGET